MEVLGDPKKKGLGVGRASQKDGTGEGTRDGDPLGLARARSRSEGAQPPGAQPHGELTWHHGGWVAQGREGHRVPRQLLQLRDLPGRYEETEALGVMAEPPDPPGWALAHTSCPRGHPPGSQQCPSTGDRDRTHLCWRDPTVLPLHGETLGGTTMGVSWGPRGDRGQQGDPRPQTPSPPEPPLTGPKPPYLVGREQDGAQGEPGVVGDGGPLRRRLEREGRKWKG